MSDPAQKVTLTSLSYYILYVLIHLIRAADLNAGLNVRSISNPTNLTTEGSLNQAECVCVCVCNSLYTNIVSRLTSVNVSQYDECCRRDVYIKHWLLLD